MVAEVCRRAGIVEREHTSNKQRTLVMTHAERTAEGGAGFAVGHVAVGKEHAAGSSKAISEFAHFAYKAVNHLNAAGNR